MGHWDAAVRFNLTASNLFGWGKDGKPIEDVSEALAISDDSTDAEVAAGVSRYQRDNGLRIDGMLGKVTLDHIRRSLPNVDQALRKAGAVSQATGPATIKDGHRGKYKSAKIDPERMAEVQRAADIIHRNRGRYLPVAMKVGIPWHVIGMIHMREASFDFSTYLHNGDPLRDAAGNPLKTVHVPRGKLFFTWEDAAVDAISGRPKHGLAINAGDVAAEIEFLERYNGLGYRKRGVPSPYVWSATQHYSKGKFVADGTYNSNVEDKQLGCMAVRIILDLSRRLT